MGPRLQGDGLVVVEVDAALPNGLLSGVALVGEAFMQFRLIEGREDLSKADRITVPIILGVGENNDVVFGKGRHVLEWIMSFKGSVCQAGRVIWK